MPKAPARDAEAFILFARTMRRLPRSVGPIPAPRHAVRVGAAVSVRAEAARLQRLGADDLAAAAGDGELEQSPAGATGANDGNVTARLPVVKIVPAAAQQPVLDYFSRHAALGVGRRLRT